MLEVDHLSFDYPGRTVLRDICFSVPPGRVCGLLGPNASGKTTLFRCINGILAPRKGEVRAMDRCLAGLSRKEVAALMAVVPQDKGGTVHFTALQMVLMARAGQLSIWQRPGKKDEDEALQALDDLGVSELALRPFNCLSGGERQVVLLARALFQQAPVLLLDEPTAHLDFRHQHRILDLIRQVAAQKQLMVLVSLHDPNLAACYCDWIVALNQGMVLDRGAAREVMRREVLEAVYDMKIRVTDTEGGPCLISPGRDFPSESDRSLR